MALSIFVQKEGWFSYLLPSRAPIVYLIDYLNFNRKFGFERIKKGVHF